MKKAATKERAFYTRTDLVNFGVTKGEADRMIAEGRHWIARKKP